MIEQEKNETAADARSANSRRPRTSREQRELIDDAFAIFEVKLTGREMLDGRA